MAKFTNDPAATFRSERLLSATPDEVFAAFEQPDVLAQWWGPDGFTNTFERFEFAAGGQWIFVMHGPDGANHHNESVFREIVPGERIVLEHTVKPHFQLTINLAAENGATRITWNQEFESPELAEQLRSICVPANEQVLNRLELALLQAGRK